MSLRKKQSEFWKAIGLLLNFIYDNGYEVGTGDTYPGKFEHSPKGKHPKGLAIDFPLFKDDVYLKETEDHFIFGQYWKGLGGIWGGDFKKPDGNHYEWPE